MKNEKAKHTPGPWKIEKAFRPVHPVDGWIIKQDNAVRYPVCLVSENIGGIRSPQKANAALIAAAPGMLVALENVLSAVAYSEEAAADILDLGEIRATIAKAKGI